MPSLEELQKALAQSLIDPSEPVTMASRESVGANQRQMAESLLAGISEEDLCRSRQTLWRKRLSQTRSLLPRTTTALAQYHEPLFRTYVTKHHFSGWRAPLLDAIAYSQFLEDRRELPVWVQELARWEAFPYRWRLSRNFIRGMSLRYAVYQPAIHITLESEPANRRTLWLGFRLFGRGAIRRVL
jgi:hypothetical protein